MNKEIGKPKKVLIGNTEYEYQVDENGEGTLIRMAKLNGKEMRVVIRGDSSRKFKRNRKKYYKYIRRTLCETKA